MGMPPRPLTPRALQKAMTKTTLLIQLHTGEGPSIYSEIADAFAKITKALRHLFTGERSHVPSAQIVTTSPTSEKSCAGSTRGGGTKGRTKKSSSQRRRIDG